MLLLVWLVSLACGAKELLLRGDGNIYYPIAGDCPLLYSWSDLIARGVEYGISIGRQAGLVPLYLRDTKSFDELEALIEAKHDREGVFLKVSANKVEVWSNNPFDGRIKLEVNVKRTSEVNWLLTVRHGDHDFDVTRLFSVKHFEMVCKALCLSPGHSFTLRNPYQLKTKGFPLIGESVVEYKAKTTTKALLKAAEAAFQKDLVQIVDTIPSMAISINNDGVLMATRQLRHTPLVNVEGEVSSTTLGNPDYVPAKNALTHFEISFDLKGEVYSITVVSVEAFVECLRDLQERSPPSFVEVRKSYPEGKEPDLSTVKREGFEITRQGAFELFTLVSKYLIVDERTLDPRIMAIQYIADRLVPIIEFVWQGGEEMIAKIR